jgi:hypothetical protein
MTMKIYPTRLWEVDVDKSSKRILRPEKVKTRMNSMTKILMTLTRMKMTKRKKSPSPKKKARSDADSLLPIRYYKITIYCLPLHQKIKEG